MIRNAVHRARRRIDCMLNPCGRGAVLLYHRVADEAFDPYGLCVTPAQFVEHMQVVRELMQSKHELEEWTSGTVPGFAYLYGRYDDTTVAAAREARFEFACSGVYRPVTPRADMFLLPRIEAPAVDGNTLRRIQQWQLQ